MRRPRTSQVYETILGRGPNVSRDQSSVQPLIKALTVRHNPIKANHADLAPSLEDSIATFCQSLMGSTKPCYGTNPMSNDLMFIVDFDKTILPLIPVKVEGNINLLTWKTAVLFVPARTI